MTRFLYIASLVILSVAHGNQEQVDTCGTQDEACLVQTSVTHHKRSKVKSVTKMHQVLADLEEEASKIPGGPAMLQDILHGVMHLPPLKSKESLFDSNRFRAALRAQLHLQHLAKRNPTLLAMIEDPHHLEQIQAALFQGDPSLSKIFAQQRRMPSNHKASLVAFSERRSSEHPGPLLVWTQGYGCETEVSCIQFPYGDAPLFSAPLFGPNCSDWPWVMKFAASYEEEGAVMLVEQWVDGASTYSVKWIGHDGIIELGKLPLSPGQWISGSAFSLEVGKLFYIVQDGSWPDYTYTLIGASEEGLETLVNITDCLYPGSLKASGFDMVWTCSKDWQKESDMNKIMKYSVGGGPPKVLYESEDWFGHLYLTPSDVYYSVYDYSMSQYSVSKCSLSEEPCNPEFFASLPDGAWNFIIQSGKLVSTTWISVKEDRPSGDTKWYTDYEVVFGYDKVARISGQEHLQIIMPPPYVSDGSEKGKESDYHEGSEKGKESDDHEGYGSGSGSGTLHFPEAKGGYGSGYGSGDFDIQLQTNKTTKPVTTGPPSMISKSITGLAKVLKNGHLART